MSPSSAAWPPRRSATAPFRDRVVHHALVRVIEPLFEPKFIEDSYACRKGKGTQAGVRRCADFARRFPFVLKCDIRRYFPSIDHAVLLQPIGKTIACPETMALIRQILATHADSVRREWGADLFDFNEHPCGLPIGNLTSQFFANIYLDGFDHFVKQELRVKGYVRYVDDFLIKSPALRAGCAGAPGTTTRTTCAPRTATTTTPRTRTTTSGSASPGP